jgi:hypothetical protein
MTHLGMNSVIVCVACRASISGHGETFTKSFSPEDAMKILMACLFLAFSFSVPAAGCVVDATGFPGQTSGDKIWNAIDSLTTGCIVDATGFSGSQNINRDLFANHVTSVPVKLLLGPATFTVTATQNFSNAGNEIVGGGMYTTIWNYTGSSDGWSLNGVLAVKFEDFQLNATGNAANLIHVQSGDNLLISRIRTLGSPTSSFI